MPANFLSRILKRPPTPAAVVVVSGLPRSGTSMMMQILQAGGLDIVTDQTRMADEDNPRGYYEFERVKKLKEGDIEWVPAAQGKAVKVISALLENLPVQFHYKILFMQRDMDEILASQKQMLLRKGEPADKVSDETLAGLFRQHLSHVETWLAAQPNIEVLYIAYHALLQNPQQHIQAVVKFLGLPLNIEAMLEVPNQSLYRQRR